MRRAVANLLRDAHREGDAGRASAPRRRARGRAPTPPRARLAAVRDLPRRVFERSGRRTLVRLRRVPGPAALRAAASTGLIRSKIQFHRDVGLLRLRRLRAGAARAALRRPPPKPRVRPDGAGRWPASARWATSTSTEAIVRRRALRGEPAADAGEAAAIRCWTSVRGHPQRAMLLAHHLWEHTERGAAADADAFAEALTAVDRELKERFQQTWQSLGRAPNQRRVLLALAQGDASLYSRPQRWRPSGVDKGGAESGRARCCVSIGEGMRTGDDVAFAAGCDQTAHARCSRDARTDERLLPARRAAHASCCARCEQGAYADRALHGEARGLDRATGRWRCSWPSARCSARRTLDHLIGRSARRRAARPAGAAPRCGSGSSSCCSSTASPTTPSSARRSSWPSASRAATASSTPCCARGRARAPAAAAADDDARRARRSRHSHPEWIVELWWDAARRRATRGRCWRADNEPAELALRANTLVGADSLGESLPARPRRRRDRRSTGRVRRPSTPSPLRRAGAFTPQSRAAMLVARDRSTRSRASACSTCARRRAARRPHLAALMGARARSSPSSATRGARRALRRDGRADGRDERRGRATRDAASRSAARRSTACSSTRRAAGSGTLRRTPTCAGAARRREARRAPRIVAASGDAARRRRARLLALRVSRRERAGRSLGLHADFAARPRSSAVSGGASAVPRPAAPHRDGTDGFYHRAARMG